MLRILMTRCLFILFIIPITTAALGQPNIDSITIHFLYGSKPKSEFKNTERKWFGGKLGGHVGIETSPDSILSFVPVGKFHWFAKHDNLHSRFVVHSRHSFPAIFGGNAADMKTLSVVIPINIKQRRVVDSLHLAFRSETPFDYAFIGMRCGSSTYYILSHLDIVKAYSFRKTYMKIFYPRRLRKRILVKAANERWTVKRHEGTTRRIWETD
jgi:hypothetical protein